MKSNYKRGFTIDSCNIALTLPGSQYFEYTIANFAYPEESVLIA